MRLEPDLQAEIGRVSVWDALAWYAQQQRSPGSLAAWTERYLEHAHAAGRRSATVKTLQSVLRRLCAAEGSKRPMDFAPPDIQRFLWQWTGASTRRRNFHLLATFYRWLETQGAVLGNPVLAAMALPRCVPQTKLIYSPNEAELLLRHSAGTELAGYWVLSLFTGMRSSEIARLGSSTACWSYIDLESRTIALPDWSTKTAPRVVPLNATALAWLQGMQGAPLYPRRGAEKFAAFSLAVLCRTRRGPGSNAGRRSFITYSLSLPDASYGATAKVAGNSETVIRRYYLQPKQPEAAQRYFGLRPEDVL